MNSDLNPGREEKLAAEAQFARFASVCRPFAPIYRQMTLGARSPLIRPAANITQAAMLAYRDVLAAWRNYLATRNHGRPFVLIGHSQGSLMLQQLIAREIENNPAVARRMKLAIIPGFNVLVPAGEAGRRHVQVDAAVQPCRRDRLRHQLDQLPREERAARRRDVRLCRPAGNDRRLRQSGAARLTRLGEARQLLVRALDPAGARRPDPLVERGAAADALSSAPKGWSRPNASTTARAAICGCAPTPTPGDKRTDRVGGEVGVLGMFLPGWGMHLADMAIAQGDLIRAGRRDQRSIQNSCSTLSPSAWASLIASVAEGVKTPFSTVLMVLRLTPTRAASSAWSSLSLAARERFISASANAMRRRSRTRS